MTIDLRTIIPTAILLFGACCKWYQRIKRVITPAILEAEKRAKDGLIDKDDRKAIAWSLIDGLVKEGKMLPLNFIRKAIVSKMIDYLARKLPDFILSKDEKLDR